MQKLLIIIGPTASGKSALGVKLAKRFNGEIISADSRQVYRGLNIGTGKVTKKEMAGIPHHLLDVASPKKSFNADDFVKHAHKVIVDIASRGRLPIVVGGTGFYIDALVGRVSLAEVAPNPVLRARLAKKTTEQLYALLQKRDLARASAMNTPSERNNRVRLIRALEIASFKNSRKGQSFVSLQRTVLCTYDCLWIGIAPPLEVLDEKIALRLRHRIKIGMIAEARRLHVGGLSYRRMVELGLEYRSLARLLKGTITRQDLVTELEIAIRQYARRQITYWKRNTKITWFSNGTQKEIALMVRPWIMRR
jgi:tRNA dimethylallyltransferase